MATNRRLSDGLDSADVVVVVGAHASAEAHDRPTAYRLADSLRTGGAGGVLVLTDLWYLNNDHVRALPAIAVGGPEVNALTAFLGDKVPSVAARSGEWVVQFDEERPLACCWGANARRTDHAVEVFEREWLGRYMALVRAQR